MADESPESDEEKRIAHYTERIYAPLSPEQRQNVYLTLRKLAYLEQKRASECRKAADAVESTELGREQVALPHAGLE